MFILKLIAVGLPLALLLLSLYLLIGSTRNGESADVTGPEAGLGWILLIAAVAVTVIELLAWAIIKVFSWPCGACSPRGCW